MRSPIRIPGSKPTRTKQDKLSLLACPIGSSNCISSKDVNAKIQPWKIKKDALTDLATIKELILSLERTALVEEIPGQYLHITFESSFFGFIDDVEFCISGDYIDIRSASRVGKSDLGVNLKRVLMLKSKLNYN